jgi:hypothetical protein
MSADRERPDYHDREKKTFSERDRMRRERRDPGGVPAASPAARARAREATRAYLDQIDSLFKGGQQAQAQKLAEAVLDARGTPELPAACRAYLEGAGLPTEARLLSCLLDTGERELVLVGLAGLASAHEAGGLEPGAGLLSQLRMLAQDSDDEIAETAEDLLEAL